MHILGQSGSFQISLPCDKYKPATSTKGRARILNMNAVSLFNIIMGKLQSHLDNVKPKYTKKEINKANIHNV